jgi:hypothetical protein
MYRRGNGSERPSPSPKGAGKCRGLGIVDRFCQVLIAEDGLKLLAIKIEVMRSAANPEGMQIARPGSSSKSNEYESDKDYPSSLDLRETPNNNVSGFAYLILGFRPCRSVAQSPRSFGRVKKRERI